MFSFFKGVGNILGLRRPSIHKEKSEQKGSGDRGSKSSRSSSRDDLLQGTSKQTDMVESKMKFEPPPSLPKPKRPPKPPKITEGNKPCSKEELGENRCAGDSLSSPSSSLSACKTEEKSDDTPVAKNTQNVLIQEQDQTSLVDLELSGKADIRHQEDSNETNRVSNDRSTDSEFVELSDAKIDISSASTDTRSDLIPGEVSYVSFKDEDTNVDLSVNNCKHGDDGVSQLLLMANLSENQEDVHVIPSSTKEHTDSVENDDKLLIKFVEDFVNNALQDSIILSSRNMVSDSRGSSISSHYDPPAGYNQCDSKNQSQKIDLIVTESHSSSSVNSKQETMQESVEEYDNYHFSDLVAVNNLQVESDKEECSSTCLEGHRGSMDELLEENISVVDKSHNDDLPTSHFATDDVSSKTAAQGTGEVSKVSELSSDYQNMNELLGEKYDNIFEATDQDMASSDVDYQTMLISSGQYESLKNPTYSDEEYDNIGDMPVLPKKVHISSVIDLPMADNVQDREQKKIPVDNSDEEYDNLSIARIENPPDLLLETFPSSPKVSTSMEPSSGVGSSATLHASLHRCAHGFGHLSLRSSFHGEEEYFEPSDEAVQVAAVEIQKMMRGFSARQKFRKQKEAAVRIQAHIRGYLTRKHLREGADTDSGIDHDGAHCCPDLASSLDEDSTDLFLLDDYSADFERMSSEEAAIEIQKVIRGYYVRKKYQEQKTAAVRIQAHIRGYLTRKHLYSHRCSLHANTNADMAACSSSIADCNLEEPDIGNILEPEIGLREVSPADDCCRTCVVPGSTLSSLGMELSGSDYDLCSCCNRGDCDQVAEYQVEQGCFSLSDDLPLDFLDRYLYDRQLRTLSKVLEGTIDEEKHSHDDAEFAATKIQAGFRGYQTRKNLNGKAESDSQPQELPQPEEEEEVDIDLEDPEVRVAALKIQKGFKNFHAAKKRPANSEANLSSSLQNDLSGKETKPEEAEAQAEVQETPKEDNVPEQDLDDPELNTAATKIQASFKGFQARKQVEGMKKEKEEQQPSVEQPSTESETIEASTHDNEEVPEDDREAAAIKIQAGFKGYKTRKDMGKVKPKEGEAAVNDSTE